MLTLADDGDPPGPGFGRPGSDGSTLGRLAGAAGALAHEGLETVLHPRHALKLAGTALEDAATLSKLLLPGSDRARRSKAISTSRTASHGQRRSSCGGSNAPPRRSTRPSTSARCRGHRRDSRLPPNARRPLDEVHALVPFNLRPPHEPLPRELGNHFGLILLALPVGVVDPVGRVNEVKRRMHVLKHSHEGAISYGILELMGRTPPLIEARLIDFFSAKGSMVLTNVPGPRHTLSVAGTPLRGVLAWAPCSGSVG